VGIQYEISYYGNITDNTLVENALGSGPRDGSVSGNVTPAIYIFQSGSDPRVSSAYSSAFEITGNDLVNNWDGVILYDTSGRYCDSVGTDICTLIDPNWNRNQTTVCDQNQDVAANNVPDYWDLCRWKTMNVHVSNNAFTFNPSTIDTLVGPGSPQCTAANFCGYTGLYAFNAGGSLQTPGCPEAHDPPWSCGTSDSVNVSYNWGNSFSDNVYNGPWSFWAYNQGDVDTWAEWTGALSGECTQSQYVCTSGFGQDAGSTYNP
jgi:hypothetical protein